MLQGILSGTKKFAQVEVCTGVMDYNQTAISMLGEGRLRIFPRH